MVKKGVTLFGLALISFLLMKAVYQQGRESGVIDGMTAGFDVGYKTKKPPVIIVVPPRDGTIVPRQPGKDSILWRI